MLPIIAGVGFVWLGLMPILSVLVVQQVIDRGARYGLAKPAREVLWTVVSREEKYKSKAFLDAAIYRGGDLVSGWIYAGLAAAGIAVGAIALLAAPLCAVWGALGIRLGRRQETLAGVEPAAAVAPAS
jgi:AAA family ATP:ADP antiporter